MMRAGGSVLVLSCVLIVGALAGCIRGDDVSPPPVEDASVVPDQVISYLHDVTVPDANLTVLGGIMEQFRIEAPDGITLDTWVVRPPADLVDGPVPVVAQVTPYYGGGPVVTTDVQTGEVYNRMGKVGDVLLAHGYAYAISSVRGTGTSDGCFTQGGPTEATDTAAVVEFLARQPWSNGNVGLIGVSYPGTTPQDVWIEAPPSLKTIVPIAGISDFYKYNFVNGVPIVPQGYAFNTYYWLLEGPLPSGPHLGVRDDPVNLVTSAAGEVCEDQVDVQQGGVTSTLDGDKDAYWQARDFVAELNADWERNAVRASVFYIHGLQDWNVKPHHMEDWLPLVQETGVPFKVMLGQWTHAWPQRDDFWNATMIAWFDQFLKEVDTGILDAPAVQVQDDMGRWRHEETWPPSEVDKTVLYPAADGVLAWEPGSGTAAFFDGSALPAPSAPLVGDLDDPLATGGQRYVVWESAPLVDDWVISGQPRFVGNVTSSGAKASVVFTLAEKNAEGLRPFNFAAQSLNHAKSLESGDPDVSGERLALDLRFFPQDDVVEAGNRIVLVASYDIAGGPGPSLQPVSTGATVTFDLTDAFLELPVDTSLVFETPVPCWPDPDDPDDDGACYQWPAERW